MPCPPPLRLCRAVRKERSTESAGTGHKHDGLRGLACSSVAPCARAVRRVHQRGTASRGVQTPGSPRLLLRPTRGRSNQLAPAAGQSCPCFCWESRVVGKDMLSNASSSPRLPPSLFATHTASRRGPRQRRYDHAVILTSFTSLAGRAIAAVVWRVALGWRETERVLCASPGSLTPAGSTPPPPGDPLPHVRRRARPRGPAGFFSSPRGSPPVRLAGGALTARG